ncbi:nitrite reductase/ring-hydroxylating ferredoxin subunit [Kribbella steppae]|uniref:Cytochrome bc1 complex Rieske iron-sulfur subunit n=1 Tax=Kribbella steppae TaxID=2512223 RepID=A0A4R2H397_9ACTN|nr:Rieske (2Fe-2S) protein [Kribbella steppae]TCO19748.1 nitrite reductase/ring-hydroxylating ferredoxin subunit [Kribbella steppae]
MSTQPEPSAPKQTLRDRRTVLRGAAVIGLAGAAMPVIAACTDGGDAGGGTTTSAPAGGAQAPGAALATTSEIPVGGGKVFGDAKVVVTQPASGQFKGFSAVCTHQGCIVADVADGTINCACHGSKFKIADGSVANGPAGTPLPAANITVQGGKIIGPAS